VTGFPRAVWLIAAKDLKSELRTRENLCTVLFFALVILVVFHFSFDLAGIRFGDVGPGLLWTAIAFAGMLGLQNAFAREREREGLSGLVLSAADPSAVYLGKALAATVALCAAEAVFVPAAALLFGADLRAAAIPLAIVLLVHTVGYVAVGTLFGAMSVGVRRGHLLLPLLQFTVTVPLLMSAVRATSGVLARATLEGAGIWLRVGIAYDMIFLCVAALLFESLVED
jgi:heme exporter protein B